MQENGIDVLQALSGTDDWIVHLSDPEANGNREIRSILCSDMTDINAIAAYIPEFCREDTPVYQIRKNKLKSVGGLTRVITENRVKKMIKVPTDLSIRVKESYRPEWITDADIVEDMNQTWNNQGVMMVSDEDIVEDMNKPWKNLDVMLVGDADIVEDMNLQSLPIIELTDDDIIEDLNRPWKNLEFMAITDDDIVDRLEANPSKRRETSFYESANYHNLFNQRKELGLSIDYFKKKDKKGNEKTDFRYRRADEAGKKGKWTSTKYVNEAIDALKQYDRLMESDDIEDLTSALKIAEKYFTKEGLDDACKKIVSRSYEVLVFKGDMQSLDYAYMLANKYFRGEEKNKANRVISTVRNSLVNEQFEVFGNPELDYVNVKTTRNNNGKKQVVYSTKPAKNAETKQYALAA